MKILGFLLLLCGIAVGQNLRYDSVAQGPKGPVPFASVAVCSQPATTSTQPCTPLANLCSSLTDLSCTSPNPITTDSLGNFHFYIQSQSPFTVQIYGTQVISPYVLPDQSAAGTTTGILVATAFPGSDIGAKINAAYAALPSTGGEIYIPAGGFSFSTPVVMSVNHKPVHLYGAGVLATSLTYTGTGISITVDTGSSNFSSVLEKFRLVGPGNGTATTGIACGSATNNGSNFSKYSLIQVAAFGTGLNFGWNCFGWQGNQITVSDNGQDVLDGAAGKENMTCFKCIISLTTPGTTGTTANGFQVSSASDWYLYSPSIDNLQLAVSGNATVRIFGGHFENPAQTSYDFFTSSGNSLELHGVLFNQDNGSTFPNGRFGSITGGSFGVFGGSAFSPITLTDFVAFSGTAYGSNHGLILNSTFSSGWMVNSGSGAIAAFSQDNQGSVVTTGVVQANTLRGSLFSTTAGSGSDLLCSATAPTISSGFNVGTIGASPNGTCSFFVNVGTGTAGSTGVLTLPASATGWSCFASNFTRADVVSETANSTTSVTLTNFGTTFAATNFTNSDVILVSCFGR